MKIIPFRMKNKSGKGPFLPLVLLHHLLESVIYLYLPQACIPLISALLTLHPMQLVLGFTSHIQNELHAHPPWLPTSDQANIVGISHEVVFIIPHLLLYFPHSFKHGSFFSLIILSKPKSSHPSYEFQQENTNPKTPILSDDWSVDNLEWDANSVLFSFRSKSGTAPSILAFGPVMSGFRLH